MLPTIVLFSWPLVIFFVFSRYRIEIALPFAIIAGNLILPVQTSLNLPLIPTLDKHSVPVIAATIFLLTTQKLNLSFRHHKGILLRHPVGSSLLILLVVAPFLTVMANGDYLSYGPVALPGLTIKDGMSAVLIAFTQTLPLLLAFKFLGHPDGQKTLLWVLIAGGLIYAIPTLLEVRLSPIFSKMIYGLQSVDWLQHLRGDGFRPLVFLKHGLLLSLFLSLCVLAALGATRFMGPKYRFQLWLAAGFLFITLIFSKSLGALLVTLFLAPIVILCSVRAQLLTAAILAGTVLVYPVLRGADMVPTDRILEYATSIDVYRAASLETRFRNENILLQKARERPLLGWGGYGRPRAYDSNGRDLSITDGYWVIVFGEGGWLQYLAKMGLLTTPLMLLVFRARKIELGPETALLAIISAANLVDLIPNAGATPITWMMTGALWGRLAHGRLQAYTDASQPTEEQQGVQHYSRSSRNKTSLQANAPSYARQFKSKVEK